MAKSKKTDESHFDDPGKIHTKLREIPPVEEGVGATKISSAKATRTATETLLEEHHVAARLLTPRARGILRLVEILGNLCSSGSSNPATEVTDSSAKAMPRKKRAEEKTTPEKEMEMSDLSRVRLRHAKIE